MEENVNTNVNNIVITNQVACLRRRRFWLNLLLVFLTGGVWLLIMPFVRV